MEIMLVLVIISILAGLTIVSTTGFLSGAKKNAARTEVASLSQMINSYQLMVGSLPQSLKDLYEQPANLADPTKWDQVSAKPIGPDPWGNEYVYTNSGNGKFEIRSNGSDGQPNTADDISNKPAGT
jgi:general secretion pathway protein G